MADLRPYREFLETKQQEGSRSGFAPLWMPDCAFDFQKAVAEWVLRAGKSAAFLDCGMGKTLIELIWSENVVRKINRPVLILTPLAVAQQTVNEGAKFGIEAIRINEGPPIRVTNFVTNYEKLHRFDANDWGGIVCDESSCLKAFDGKRRAQVTEFMRRIPYRLMATATAAPNDYIELGTTSEALGIMGQVDMLNRFFKNDQNTSDMKRGRTYYASSGYSQNGQARGAISAGWRFKGHAAAPFWRWVCSWTRAGRKPSDLGSFADDKFVLPPLIEREHIVKTRSLAPGYLAELPAKNRAEELEERRRTIQERCELAASLVADTGEPFIIWCQLNPEGDLLEKLLFYDCIQISGSDSDEAKEEKYQAFLSGEARGMVSKQRIGGWGLNCQHCAHVVEFADHSFEAHYQGVRRCWRFGQTRPVINDIIATEGQRGAKENMQRKSEAADRMFDALVEHMHRSERIDIGYHADQREQVPAWL